MRILTAMFLCPFFFKSFQAKGDQPGKISVPAVPSVRSVFVSSEIAPGHETRFTFKVAHCLEDSVLPRIETYTSEAQLPSVDDGKPKPVRTVHMYLFARNFNRCALKIKKLNNSVELESVVPADPKRMTHLYLTMSDGVSYYMVSRAVPEATKR
jgi:hypothetical protein